MYIFENSLNVYILGLERVKLINLNYLNKRKELID